MDDSQTTADLEEVQEDEASFSLVRKKDIYDSVTVTTGLRRREVREAVDATFAYLFDCLSQGKDVQCPPLGKFRVITRGEGDSEKKNYKLILQKPGSGKKDAGDAQEALEAAED